MQMGEDQMLFFPFSPDSGKATGAIVQGVMHKPSKDGSLIYLNANQGMEGILSRIEKSGAEVLLHKTAIGEHGFIAFFIDSEGNRIGLHSGE